MSQTLYETVASADEREAAITAAFGEEGPARAASMRARRHPCPWPPCRSGTGEVCMTMGRRRRFSHPSRVALNGPCEAHGAAEGEVCRPGDAELVCQERIELHAETLASMVPPEAITPPHERLSAVQRADHPTTPTEGNEDVPGEAGGGD